MKSFQFSAKLRYFLAFFALAIALASLFYTNKLANELQRREETILKQGAAAKELSARPYYNPHVATFEALQAWLATQKQVSPSRRDSFQIALQWAMEMPPTEPLEFMLRVSETNIATVPAVLTDSTQENISHYTNITIDSTRLSSEEIKTLLKNKIKNLDGEFEPIKVQVAVEGFGKFVQYIHYGESEIVRQLRWFPFIQLAFVALFVLVGYAGLTYLRRSEQSYLWVGMAKEAAHQLGTPTSSLMGWIELMRQGPLDPEVEQELVGELEKDVARLERVANRFSKIGSQVHLKPQAIAPVIHQVCDYMRRRIPQQGKRETQLLVEVPPDLKVPLAPDLFEWVLENLIKNALDAMDKNKGIIQVQARSQDDKLVIYVRDNGKGIEKHVQKNVFKPGFSTKKRGWGLGLSLAKRIVEESHHGTIVLAQSKLGEGTEFRIELPFATETA